MFNVLNATEYDRVSRLIGDRSSFKVKAGQFVELVNGKVAAVTASTNPLTAVCYLCATSISGSIYESHETKSGRISIIMAPGIRAEVDGDTISGAVASGDILAIDPANPGKAKVATAGQIQLARVIAVNGDKVEIITVSPAKA